MESRYNNTLEKKDSCICNLISKLGLVTLSQYILYEGKRKVKLSRLPHTTSTRWSCLVSLKAFINSPHARSGLRSRIFSKYLVLFSCERSNKLSKSAWQRTFRWPSFMMTLLGFRLSINFAEFLDKKFVCSNVISLSSDNTHTFM